MTLLLLLLSHFSFPPLGQKCFPTLPSRLSHIYLLTRKFRWPAACFSRKHVFSENSVLHYDPRSPRTPHNSDCFDPKQTGNRNPAGCKTILQQTSASFQFLARDNLRQLSVHCENCCILYYVGLVLTRPLMLIISVKSILHPQCVTTASNWHRRTMNQYWDIKNRTIYLIGLKNTLIWSTHDIGCRLPV